MAITKAVLAISVIVVLIVAGVGGYEAGILGKSSTGATVTTTVGGGAGATVTTTVTGTGASNFNQTLVDLAKAEGGTLTCYCVMDSGDWSGTMNAILLQSFPWMKVNYQGLDPGTIATKGIQDYQAGKVQADVFVDTLAPVVQLIEAGAVTPYNNYVLQLTNISSANLDPANNWEPTFNLPIILEYNTNLVSPADAAWMQSHTIEQVLTNSTFNGHIALDSPSLLNVAGTLFASLFNADFNNNNATWTTFLNNVKANGIQWQSSGGDVYTTVESGSAWLGVGLLNDYLSGPSGAPVKDIFYSTTYVLPVAAAMAKNAPQPYTAELFLQWLASYAGQVALAKTGRTPYFGTVANQYFSGTIPSGTTLVSGGVFSGSTYYTDANGWSAYYTAQVH